MFIYPLVLVNNRSRGRWSLEWDEVDLRLKTPVGEVVLEIPITQMHMIIDLEALLKRRKLVLATPNGILDFRRNKEACKSVRAMVVSAIRGDVEYQVALKRHAWRSIAFGSGMFAICGSLFGLYCWWASWAKDPPVGHWLYSIGGLIHFALLVLLGLTLRGFFTMWNSWRHLQLLWEIK